MNTKQDYSAKPTSATSPICATNPAQLPFPAQADLDSLADSINTAHADAQAHAAKAVERALVAGDLLNKVKAQLKHGEFLPWCKAHCPAISQRTIQNYMRVARELPAEIRTDAYLGLNEALRMVAGEATPTLELVGSPKKVPYWINFDPSKNAAFCRMWPKDRIQACVYMNAQRMKWDEIATRLGLDIREVESALDSEFPDIAWEVRDEDDPRGHQRFVNEIKSAAKRVIHSIKAQRLQGAACLADDCGDYTLAYILKGQAIGSEQSAKRYDRLSHPLTDSIGTALARAALGIGHFAPALWIETAKAAVWVDIHYCDIDTAEYHKAYATSDFCKDSLEKLGEMSFRELENRRKQIWDFDNHWGFDLHKQIPESAIKKLHREIYPS